MTPQVTYGSEQPPNSQVSDVSTATCSQNSVTYYVEKECQTIGGGYLSNDEFEELLKKASSNPDFQNDLQKIKAMVSSNMVQPKMDSNNMNNINNMKKYAKILALKIFTLA